MPPLTPILARTSIMPHHDISALQTVKIPCLVLLDAYDRSCASSKQFLQLYITYILLAGNAFASVTLKIIWVLLYTKTGHISTYVLLVF